MRCLVNTYFVAKNIILDYNLDKISSQVWVISPEQLMHTVRVAAENGQSFLMCPLLYMNQEEIVK